MGLQLKHETLFVLLSLVNLINYIDRGIIPGAYNEFNSFVADTVDSDRPSLFLGLLQSAFIVGACCRDVVVRAFSAWTGAEIWALDCVSGISISSVVFGNLVHSHSPFKLIGIGLTVWILAVIISGLSYYADSYVMLIISRMLSGVGEASFQCSVPPFIAHHSGPKKGMWTSVFYTAIPVGTALGYTYGAGIATSPLKWGFAFFIEGLLMFPFVVLCFMIAPQYKPLTQEQQEQDAPLLIDTEGMRRSRGDLSVLERKHTAPSAWDEAKIVLTNPQFLSVSLGYAAYTGSLIGLSTFGSAFLMGLGHFNHETEASTFFGGAISMAGLIGTPIGGLLIDKANKHVYKRENVSVQLVSAFDDTDDASDDDEDARAQVQKPKQSYLEALELVVSTQQIAWMTLIGATIVILTYFAHDKGAFLFTITLGCMFLFVATAGVNLSVMLAVPPLNRSFAVGLNTFLVHALGDVPSPIIAGYLKDELAPGCTGDDDEVAISDECRDEKAGQRLTMLLITLWLGWSVLLFFLAHFLARKSVKEMRQSRRTIPPRLSDRLSDLMKSADSEEDGLSANLLAKH